MKKLLTIAMLAMGVTLAAQNSEKTSETTQKTRFGFTGGFNRASSNIMGSMHYVYDRGTDWSSEYHSEYYRDNTHTGFYGGFFVEYYLSEKLKLQQEINYSSTYYKGESSNRLALPVLLKYYFVDNAYVLAGPTFDISLEDTPDFSRNYDIGLTAGFGIDLSKDFFVFARYSFGTIDSIKDDKNIAPPFNNNYKRLDFHIIKSEFDVFTNYLQIGLGVKF